LQIELQIKRLFAIWGWVAKISETNSAECPGWNLRFMRIFLETPIVVRSGKNITVRVELVEPFSLDKTSLRLAQAERFIGNCFNETY
jgi:hypothetical protein